MLEGYSTMLWIVGLIAEKNRPADVYSDQWSSQFFHAFNEYGMQFRESGKPLDLLAVRWDCVVSRAQVRMSRLLLGSPLSLMEGL